MSLDLLPKSHTEFSEKNYWEKFFKKWGPKAFEWYGEYPSLCGILHKYVKPADQILMVGCGNSSLSADMYDVGYKNITNIDISEVVIKQMIEKNRDKRPDMAFTKMDMLEMTYKDGEYSVVLDKGTLDAIMTDSKEATIETVEKMFSEIGRVLKVGGRYVCVSLAQDHILRKAVEFFSSEGYFVRVCRVADVDSEEGRDFHMPVFVFVCTKMKMKLPSPILEAMFFEDASPERFGSVEDLIAAIKQVQQYGLIRSRVGKGSLDNQLSLDLYGPKIAAPRYTLHVVDTPRASNKARLNVFAIFIVPEGRETEWMFCSDEGRKELAKNAGFERLVVVTLHREHTYMSLDDVKSELSSKVMELSPEGVGNKQVPFLSVGEEINLRRVRHRDHSKLSGPLVVEDVEAGNDLYRRLIFLNNKNVVQSEARLVRVKKKKGKKGPVEEQLVVDKNHLGSSYYSVLVSGLALMENFSETLESKPKMLILGLGGGGLPYFIYHQYPTFEVEVVEIDETVAHVAEHWFDLKIDNRLKVTIGDALDEVGKSAAQKEINQRHIVILDVDSKDMSEGMSCPPQVFLSHQFLKDVANILHPKGVFMINLVCRNQQLKESVISTLKSVFPTIYSKQLTDDVNEILFALSPQRQLQLDLSDGQGIPKLLSEGLKILQDKVRAHQKGGASGTRTEIFSLMSKLEDLKLL